MFGIFDLEKKLLKWLFIKLFFSSDEQIHISTHCQQCKTSYCTGKLTDDTRALGIHDIKIFCQIRYFPTRSGRLPLLIYAHIFSTKSQSASIHFCTQNANIQLFYINVHIHWGNWENYLVHGFALCVQLMSYLQKCSLQADVELLVFKTLSADTDDLLLLSLKIT